MRIVSENLSYTYNGGSKFAVKALSDVSLTIEEGEFFGIIGKTGSGKSTFIQHLNGLIPLTDGSLTVGEFDLSKNKKRRDRANFKELRRRVGMVFQYPEYQLFAETVFDDVAFGVRNFFPKMDKAEVETRVKAAIETVGLNYDEVKSRSPFDLSGGQKRRAAIAGVIVSEPEILVLDEPVAGLDPAGKKELWSLLHKLGGGKKTVVVVSHDMNDVAENCDRIAVFDGGKVVAVGAPREIFSSPIVTESAGLGLPVTAYLTRRLEAVGVKIDTDFTVESFASAVAKAYRERGSANSD